MANFVLTEGTALSDSSGVRRYNRKRGPVEELTIILDEQKVVAANGAIAAADTIDIADVFAGDTVISGYAQVLVAGGTATATLDLELQGGTANGLGAALDADAAAGTLVGGAPADFAAADATLRVTVNTAGLSSATSGRWQFHALIHRGSEQAQKSFETYANDPNTPPQN